MSFYQDAGSWMATELRSERDALIEHLFSTICAWLRDQSMNRPRMKTALAETMRELREKRQSRVPPLTNWKPV
jgi:hypothetical protein